MEIGLLGVVTVTVGDARREIGASKVRTMLAALALESGRTVSHRELAEELWPRQSLRNPRNALQAHATRIRKVLHPPHCEGDSILHAVSNGYVLQVNDTCVDANRFVNLAERASVVVRSDASHAIDLLEDALSLWRGPALADAGEGLRCRSAAALLEERRLAAWEDLAVARLARGENRQAIADLQQLVAAHPTRERFYEQLMLALYRSGRQYEAVTLFHRLKEKLDKDLGVLPSAALHRMFSRILTQDPDLDSAVSVLSH